MSESESTFQNMEHFVIEEGTRDETGMLRTQPWGESILPKSDTKLVFVGRHVIRFTTTVESHIGYSEFTIPESFLEMIEEDNLDYITFTVKGKGTGLKFRLTPVWKSPT